MMDDVQKLFLYLKMLRIQVDRTKVNREQVLQKAFRVLNIYEDSKLMSFLEGKRLQERMSLQKTVALAMHFAEGEILKNKYKRLAEVLWQIERNKIEERRRQNIKRNFEPAQQREQKRRQAQFGYIFRQGLSKVSKSLTKFLKKEATVTKHESHQYEIVSEKDEFGMQGQQQD